MVSIYKEFEGVFKDKRVVEDMQWRSGELHCKTLTVFGSKDGLLLTYACGF